ncbi:hypothetical protein CTAYLR_004212 [Chrysophaeum taylorii]|uniref:Mediator of RNA polymerase II transcription subunit 6 n=1 Tax=Chrysophaeum taylorii TaxID=2483200 RepID=A0AAD7XK35_9STRA|nr:hypothetical protein CTAYLR_004212 [Chrysophaeum taylorii]
MFCTHGEGAEFHLEGVLPHPSGRQAIVIKRRKRRSEHVSDVQAVYYILDGTIFQCPGILELVTSRLSKCAYHLEKGFDDIRAQCERQQLQKFKDDFNLGDDADTPLPTSEDQQQQQQQQQQQGVGGLEPLDAPMEL